MSMKEHRVLDPTIPRLKEASLRKLVAAANEAFRHGTLREVRHQACSPPKPDEKRQSQTGSSH